MASTPRLKPSQWRRRKLRLVHRWLGLVVAVQLLFWVAGGLIMSSLRLEAVRGEHLAATAEPAVIEDLQSLRPVHEVARAHADDSLQSLRLTTLLSQPVYLLEAADERILVDARSGERLSPLDAVFASRIAAADYIGDGQPGAPEWIDTPELEFRGRDLPLWRVRFDDARDSTLYISAETGTVVARRNDLWRLFDFVWMLHIMDYDERERINHPLLIVFAASALMFVITGLFMLGYALRPARR